VITGWLAGKVGTVTGTAVGRTVGSGLKMLGRVGVSWQASVERTTKVTDSQRENFFIAAILF
jgi:hypothetical protein